MANNRLQQRMLPLVGRHELFRWLTGSTGIDIDPFNSILCANPVSDVQGYSNSKKR